MQKGNGVRALMLSLIGFAMIIFIPWLCVKSTSSAMNYLRDGTEVQCRVVSVEEHKKGKQLVHAVYTADTGEEILAEATMNRRTSKGESFTALVTDADPEKVYCPPSNSLIAVFAVIMTALWISGFVVFFMGHHDSIVNRMLTKNGKPALAEVVSVKQIDQFAFECKMRYNDSRGGEHTGKFIVKKSRPVIGDKFHIVYCLKKNGKAVADIIEI